MDGVSSWWDYVSDNRDDIIEATIDHAQLVLTSMFWAFIIAVGLGILTYRVKPLRAPMLSIASIFLTIPSLALFAIFIPVSFIGLGDRGPIIALTMYSIMPILRNTLTGLEEVDSAIVESARGMGMSELQRLRRVEMPLAWPVIVAGVRVSTLLNMGIAAIAALVGGTGLGIYIRDGLTRYPNPTSLERTWTGVVFIVVLALVFDLIFALIQRLTTSKGIRR